MSKLSKKIILPALAVILLFGLFGFYKNSAKAAINYTFKTDGSYKWMIEDGNLTNYVDVYDKTTNQKITTLKVYYKNNGNGILSSYSSSAGGAPPSESKIGDYTRYSVASTSDSKFAIPSQYVGNYHILAAPGTTQIYANVFYTANPTGSFIGYSFRAAGGNMFLQASQPKTNDWYGVYLNDTMVSIKNGGQTVTPASGTTATGSTVTEGCGGTDTSDCKLSDPPSANTADNDLPTISETLKQSNITTAWSLSLDLVNVLAIFFLLIIAFANILHLDPETWNFKRLLPALIVGLICANLSHLFCRAMIDFAAMLMNFLIPKELASQYIYSIYLGMFSGWSGWATGITLGAVVVAFLANLGCAAILIGLVILGIPVIITLILWFMLAARIYVLWFLVILSPIAFFGMFFDPLKRIIGTWWNWFLMWVVIGPIAYFFIYLAEGFGRDPSTMAKTTMTCFDPSNADQIGGLTKYLIVNILLVLAIYIPYSIGSKFGMALWMGLGKFMGGLGLHAGGGVGAGAIRGAGHGLSKITGGKFGGGWKKVQNPFTLPALPRGWETSPMGMLWENRRKADTENLSRDLRERLTSGGPLRRIKGMLGWGDNMIKEDMQKFNDTSGWSAEGLVNHMNEGVGENNRLKMARGVRGLSLMAKDGRRPDEQRAAQRALDQLGVTSDEVASPENVAKLVGTAQKSGGFEMDETKVNLNRDSRTHIPQNFQAKKPVEKSDDLRKKGETNVVEPLKPYDNREPNRGPARGGAAEAPPIRPTPEAEMPYLEEPPGGGTPPTTPPAAPPPAI